LAREAREEDQRARKELEQKLARMEKGKASSKSSSSCVEAKEEDSHASDSATVVYRRVSGSGSSSVKARYYELKEMADEMATIDENAKLKKDNLLMKRAMNEA
jgi:mannitol-specific phosphotransferase system IIBC component